LDAQKVELVYARPKGVHRLKYASVAGFFLFALGAICHFTFDSDVAWMVAVIGGALWVIFGSAYRKIAVN
jgi:hypothetical protein